MAILTGAPIRYAGMPSVCPTREAPGGIAAGAKEFAGLVGSIFNCAASRLPWRKILCHDGSGHRNGGNADCTLKSGKPVNHSASTHCVDPLRHTGCGDAQARCANTSCEDGGGKFAEMIANGVMLRNAGPPSPGCGASVRALKIATTFPPSDKCASDKCATLSKADSGMARSGRNLAASVVGTYGAHGVTIADRVCAVEHVFELYGTTSCGHADKLHVIYDAKALNITGSDGNDRYTGGNFAVDIGMASARRSSRTFAPAAADMGIKARGSFRDDAGDGSVLTGTNRPPTIAVRSSVKKRPRPDRRILDALATGIACPQSTMARQVPERVRVDHAAPRGVGARSRFAHSRRNRVAPRHIEDKYGSEGQLGPFRNREDRGVRRPRPLAGQTAAADLPGERNDKAQVREKRTKSLSPKGTTAAALLDANRGGAWAWRDHAGALEIEIPDPPPFSDGIAGLRDRKIPEARAQYRARGLKRHLSPAAHKTLDAAAAGLMNAPMCHRAIPGAADEAGSDPVGRTEAEAARGTPALVDPLIGTTRNAFARKKEACLSG